MREPILIACAVYLGLVLALYGVIAYRWTRERRRAWGEYSQREDI